MVNLAKCEDYLGCYVTRINKALSSVYTSVTPLVLKVVGVPATDVKILFFFCTHILEISEPNDADPGSAEQSDGCTEFAQAILGTTSDLVKHTQ